MGKIIKNGLAYSGTVEEARFTKYDNSNSGLVADNVQAAIDEVLCTGKTGTIYNTALGNSININDSIEAGYQQFIIYGKSVQEGTPSIDNPVDVVSAGEYGNINITITGDTNETNYPTLSSTIPTNNKLSGIPVSSNGNYVDADDNQWVSNIIDKGRGKYIEAVNNIVLTGKENWTVEATNTDGKNRFRYDLVTEYHAWSDSADTSVAIPTLCKYFTSVSSDDTFNNIEGIAINNGYSVYVYAESLSGYTVDQFKEWLTTHTISLYYPLATPDVYNLDDNQINILKQLKSFAPVTNISTDDICDIKVEYFRNTPVGYSVGSLQTNIDSMSTSNDKELTKVEYDALSYEEKHNGTVYYVVDDDTGGGTSGGGSSNTGVEITKAEYDALPYEAKHNGTVYYVTDLNSSDDPFSGYLRKSEIDTTLTVEGTAADAKSVGDMLTASDNTRFRFGVTEDGKYGYIITDEAGADTVIPFNSGGGSAESLYEALQYSGLVTEDMTYDEMLEALANYFPEILELDLLQTTTDDWLFTWSAYNGLDPGVNTFEITSTKFYSKVQGSGSSSIGVSERIYQNIDMNRYKALYITGSVNQSSYESSGVWVKFILRNKSTLEETVIKEYSATSTATQKQTVNISYDVSELTEHYDLIVRASHYVQRYHEVTLTEFRLHN